jgi:hypothetical protein
MKVYAEPEERGMPLGFHAGPSWADSMTTTINRFFSVHAMSFVTCNMGHLTNWIVNGIPERFPNLKTLWIESGLAWVPFMMQRLDHEYLMRQSDAPLLKKLPSDYMREMYYTSQPMEITDLQLLEGTFRAMDTEHTLMWSSDWPHWDFDLPGRLFQLPFLSDGGRRSTSPSTSSWRPPRATWPSSRVSTTSTGESGWAPPSTLSRGGLSAPSPPGHSAAPRYPPPGTNRPVRSFSGRPSCATSRPRR